jgi:hypothetical protein
MDPRERALRSPGLRLLIVHSCTAPSRARSVHYGTNARSRLSTGVMRHDLDECRQTPAYAS